MPHKAKFRPIQLKDGSAWYVLYTPDKGPTEHIEGFYTEEDALEWIKFESTSWLASPVVTHPGRSASMSPTRRELLLATSAGLLLRTLSRTSAQEKGKPKK